MACFRLALLHNDEDVTRDSKDMKRPLYNSFSKDRVKLRTLCIFNGFRVISTLVMAFAAYSSRKMKFERHKG